MIIIIIMIERHIKGVKKTIAYKQFGFDHGHRNKSCSACLKSQGIELDNLTTLNLTHLFHL